MKIYIAAMLKRTVHEHFKGQLYRLASYHYMAKVELDYLPYHKDFIIDSGVFSFLNGGKATEGVDWDEYVHKYGNYVKDLKIKNYVEVDIDRLIGEKEVIKLRKKLEKIVGWKSMPVWHMNRSYESWLKICRDYDYVCFGAFLTDGLPKSKFSGIKIFLDDAKRNNCKVHGLGFTSFPWLKKLKFYSVDSSSWQFGNRSGTYSLFEGDKVKVYKKPEGTRVAPGDALYIHNLGEWVKYANWADRNL